jgi:hypothetical protein
MRIYNLDSDKKVNKVIIYLTPDEAQEMRDSLELLINNKEKHHHEHIPDSDFKREITVCIYTECNISSFDERSRRLILRDE